MHYYWERALNNIHKVASNETFSIAVSQQGHTVLFLTFYASYSLSNFVSKSEELGNEFLNRWVNIIIFILVLLNLCDEFFW